LIYLTAQKARKEDILGTLAELEESQWWPEERLLELQWDRFKSILQYAYDENPFYRERFKAAGIEPGDIKTRADLKAIPIITKADIRENYDKILNTNIELTETLSTSGSMAEPLMMTRCRESMAHHRANMFRFRHWYNADIGGFEATFRGTNFPPKDLLKLKFKDFLLNRWRLHERDLSRKNMDAYFRKLQRCKPSTFYGFPTLMEKFTEHIIESGVKAKPFPSLNVIIPTSEMAHERQRKDWREFYGVPVADEYGCTEAGILGVACPEGNWHVPVESVLVEFIKLDQDTNDEEAYTIIVTDLMNRSMPIIRYDVGDSALPGDGPCACGRGLPTMKSFLGRIAKLIDLPDGRTIHSLDFYYIFRKAGEIRPDAIKEFQVRIIQPRVFQIYIVRGSQFNDETMDFLTHKIGFALGPQSVVEYKFVDEIESIGHGKFEKVIFLNK
jgi:phenylacetate-CoA ligase